MNAFFRFMGMIFTGFLVILLLYGVLCLGKAIAPEKVVIREVVKEVPVYKERVIEKEVTKVVKVSVPRQEKETPKKVSPKKEVKEKEVVVVVAYVDTRPHGLRPPPPPPARFASPMNRRPLPPPHPRRR